MNNAIKKVGYVLKRYPRYSETFVVNEILAHEQAALDINIFALRPPVDTHFQDIIARVRAPVTYLPYGGVKTQDFWKCIEETALLIPQIWQRLAYASGEHSRDIIQAVVMAGLIKQSGIEHLHAHFATSAASVARLAAYFANITYSITAHAKDIFHESVDENDVRQKLEAAAAVITVSNYNVKFLNKHYGRSAANVVGIYNGLDLGQFPFKATQDRAPHIIAVGRLIEKKGFIDLIDACKHLTDRGVAYSCSIIGSGDLEGELQDRIKVQELTNVHMLGPRPQQEIKQLVQDASVFAAPCVVGSDGNQDGLPTVLLESMALGTPCISTDVTGIPEAVIDNKTGLIVPQHNPEHLADALEILLNNTGLRSKLANNARALIEQSFDIHKNAGKVRQAFNNNLESAVAQVKEAS